jgi:hypothetical protein
MGSDAAHSVIFAETVPISGGTVALVLAVMVLMFAVACFLVIAGSIWAVRAGRGSTRARTGWVAVVTVEGLLALASVRVPGILAVVLLVMAFQAVLFVRARP